MARKGTPMINISDTSEATRRCPNIKSDLAGSPEQRTKLKGNNQESATSYYLAYLINSRCQTYIVIATLNQNTYIMWIKQEVIELP